MKKYGVVNDEIIFRTCRMIGLKRTLEAEDGDSITHTIIHSEPSTAIIIFNEYGQIAFIRQFRSSTNRYYIELPAGIKDSRDLNILETAKREAQEETGLVIKRVEMLVKGPSMLDPSKSDEDYGVALAYVEGTTTRELDKGERIDEEIIWLDRSMAYGCLKNQMTYGNPFYKGLYMSGHSIYALLAYRFLRYWN